MDFTDLSKFKPVPGFPSYVVSSCGEIFRASQGLTTWATPGKLISHEITRDGHHRVTLFNDGTRGRRMVHRVVCEAWNGPPPRKDSLACHIDDDKNNNHFSNLYWGCEKSNGADRVRNGISVRGERVNTAKLTEAQVIDIRNAASHGSLNVELAAIYGVPDASISMIVRGKSWKHVGGPIISQSRRGKVRPRAANDNAELSKREAQ